MSRFKLERALRATTLGLGIALATIATAVPFTVEDVINLRNAERSGNAGASIGDLIAQRTGGVSGTAPAAAAPPPAPPAGAAKPGANFPATNAKGWRKMKDAQGNYAYVGPNGEVEEISSGF